MFGGPNELSQFGSQSSKKIIYKLCHIYSQHSFTEKIYQRFAKRELKRSLALKMYRLPPNKCSSQNLKILYATFANPLFVLSFEYGDFKYQSKNEDTIQILFIQQIILKNYTQT